MRPIKFNECNCVLAENQDEYLTLHAHRSNDHYGVVTSCWKLTITERFLLLFGGRIWVSLCTFNQPTQPQKIQLKSPFALKGEG